MSQNNKEFAKKFLDITKRMDNIGFNTSNNYKSVYFYLIINLLLTPKNLYQKLEKI